MDTAGCADTLAGTENRMASSNDPQWRTAPARPPRDAIAAWLAAKVAGPLGIRPDEVDTRRPLAGFGIGSLQAVRLAAELEEWLGRKLSPTLVYDYPTIDALARFLAGEDLPASDAAGGPATGRCQGREPIAIIGIGCRFPGATGPTRSGDCSATASRRSARSRPRAGTARP